MNNVYRACGPLVTDDGSARLSADAEKKGRATAARAVAQGENRLIFALCFFISVSAFMLLFMIGVLAAILITGGSEQEGIDYLSEGCALVFALVLSAPLRAGYLALCASSVKNGEMRADSSLFLSAFSSPRVFFRALLLESIRTFSLTLPLAVSVFLCDVFPEAEPVAIIAAGALLCFPFSLLTYPVRRFALCGLLFPGTAVRRISPSLNNMHGGLSRALRRMDTRDVGILYLSALTVFILSALHCSHISAASRTAVMIDGGIAEHND
ncbi:MAG: hypothetical protein ILO42_03840 [Clostridia bacterium]|nr:hypothetical protein [Clostridia bacterium]